MAARVAPTALRALSIPLLGFAIFLSFSLVVAALLRFLVPSRLQRAAFEASEVVVRWLLTRERAAFFAP